MKCCGCDAIKLRHTSWFSEDEGSSVAYFPPAVSRRHPSWFDELVSELPPQEEFVATLLNEIYVALHNNLLSLATMGVRALLEKVMIAQVGDLGSFAAHVRKFEDLGHVSPLQRARLDAILEAGHAAMHRMYAPSEEDVVVVLDIAESIIASIYVHDSLVRGLKQRVPAKVAKVPKGGKP